MHLSLQVPQRMLNLSSLPRIFCHQDRQRAETLDIPPPRRNSSASDSHSPTDFEQTSPQLQTPVAEQSGRSSLTASGPGFSPADLEKAPPAPPGAPSSPPGSVLGRVLSRTVSRVPDGPEPGPPPDGGTQAWLQVVIAHLSVVNAWGYIQTYGAFQTYYVRALARPPSDVAWVGTFQVFALFFFGTLSGRTTDAGYFRAVFLAGSALTLLGIFTTSFATQYWQLFLAQGVCQGLANGLAFCAVVSVVSAYFRRNRALALALVACGTSTGGMVYPAMVETLLPRLGFAWTVRAIGLVMLVLQSIAVLCARPRLPPRKAGPFLDYTAFREPAFILFSLGMFLVLWAWFIAFYYVGSFARAALGADDGFAINELLLMNGMGIPGRIVPALLADRVLGPLNTIALCTLCTGALLAGWPGVSSLASLSAFSTLYGFFASGILGLFPAVLGVMTPHVSLTGVRLGMAFTFVSFACLTGAPIGGALLQAGHGSYLPPQLFALATMLAGAAFLAAARVSKTGWKLAVRI